MGDEAGGRVTGHHHRSHVERGGRIVHGAPFSSRPARALLALGLGLTAFGTWGLFADADRTNPEQWVRWFLGALVAHDFVIAPVAFGFGALIGRRLPPAIQSGLIASAVLMLTVYPWLRGYGRRPDNPTILPNDYAAGLALTLAFVWGIVALTHLYRRRARRR